MSGNSSVRYCGCGARLARDNPDTRCSPCQQKARDLALRPPQVPPELWDTERMRDALAGRHMGRVVCAYRHHPFHGTPLSQGLVAGWLGIGQAQLSRTEHGPPITDLDKRTRWAHPSAPAVIRPARPLTARTAASRRPARRRGCHDGLAGPDAD